MTRFRFLVPLLALALLVPAGPIAAQSDSRTIGDVIADAIEDVARKVGSAQDDISDLAEGIDPSDPDAEVDPGPQLEPADPAGTDPEDPGDSDPSEPSDPGEPSDPEGEIDLPPSEPEEEGGFLEIQLIPDPVPKAGRWKATNKVGTVACTGSAGGKRGGIVQKIAKSTETGRIAVRDEGRTLVGRGLAQGQSAPLVLSWDPDTERFKGSVTAAAAGGRTKIKFDFRVVSANRLEGELIANVRVDAQGVKSKCTVGRAVSLKRQGGS